MGILFDHLHVGRLISKEKTKINQLIKNMVKSNQNLLTFKVQDQTNFSAIKTIYNEHWRHRLQERGSRT